MGAYTKATREHGASNGMAPMRRVVPLISAIVASSIVGVAAHTEAGPAGITSLLGQPLTAQALAWRTAEYLGKNWKSIAK